MPTPRFLTLDDVAEILNVSWSQAYALVRRKELIAIQIGGRGQWRVETDELIPDGDVEDALVALAVGPIAHAASRQPPRRSDCWSCRPWSCPATTPTPTA